MPKILAVVQYNYPQVTTVGGADTMLRDLLEQLVSRGWTATAVIVGGPPFSGMVGNVQVYRTKDQQQLAALVNATDVLITHLGAIDVARKGAKRFNKPLVQLVHNTSSLTTAELGRGASLVVYNTEWIRKYHHLEANPLNRRRLVSFPGIKDIPYVVVHPPALEPPSFRGDPLGPVTLVNLTPNKNPEMLYRLAEVNEGIPFRGVRGGYDVDGQVLANLPNLEILPFGAPDVIYKNTSVVIVPSRYESYSRVAVEAMARGIPVIGADTPGLRECLGLRQWIIPIENFMAWDAALEVTLFRYDEASKTALRRAQQLYEQTPEELNQLDTKLRSLLGNH